MRTKAGFSITREAKSKLAALSIASGQPMSSIVESGIEARVATLSPEERRRFDAAREARGEADDEVEG